MSDELLYFNGINGASGEYETTPLTLEQLAKIAQGEQLDEKEVKELQLKNKAKTEGHWAVKEGVDPKDLSQTGWGVIFAFADKDKTPAVKEALQPLLDHRRALAAKNKEQYYKEYIGPAAYRPNESKNDFLARQGAGPGPADPEKVPYYLLVVGDPESIPYRVQYQLDVQYAVGRIHFDTVEEYAQYARNVVLAEQQAAFLGRRAVFFGVANPDDQATSLSAEKLVKPLAGLMAKDQPGWAVNTFAPADSTKARMGQLLNGGDAPALLFAASHGMGFPSGDPHQLAHQGALLCQDWPGPQAWRKPIPADHYFSGDDLTSNANLLGLLAFFFACYGAGTPRLDEFGHATRQRGEIAPKPFVANLPRKMLARGALAVVGHVERAWGTSFIWDRAGVQLEVFKSSLKRLMEGHPVGSAFEYFNERYAELSSDLSTQLEEIQFGAEVDNEKIAGMWTANNDARSYVVIGDPAARLPVVVTDAKPAAARPGLTTELKPIPKAAAKAADPAQQAQADADALVTRMANALSQALSGAGAELSGVTYDAKKREISAAAKVRGQASLGGEAWAVEVECKVSGKKL